MQPGPAFVVGLLIVLVILVIAAYVWYHYTGWKSFSYDAGKTVTFSAGTDKDGNDRSAGNVRFKNCIFTLTSPVDGTTRSQDVTGTLNGMALAYSGAYNPPQAFSLGGKLCAKWLDYADPKKPTCTLAAAPMSGTVTCCKTGDPRPLNAFSFTIKGFNDRATVPSAGHAARWGGATVTLTGQTRVI